VVESSALLKRRSPKGYRGFESLPHRVFLVLVLVIVPANFQLKGGSA
jgi:hypothetical protein